MTILTIFPSLSLYRRTLSGYYVVKATAFNLTHLNNTYTKRNTASRVLNMMFQLDSLETSHFFFVALAEYFDVKIGTLDSLPARMAALETLTTAMAFDLRGATAGPSFNDISARANQLVIDDPMLSQHSTPRPQRVPDPDIVVTHVEPPPKKARTPKSTKGQKVKSKDSTPENKPPNEQQDASSRSKN